MLDRKVVVPASRGTRPTESVEGLPRGVMVGADRHRMPPRI